MQRNFSRFKLLSCVLHWKFLAGCNIEGIGKETAQCREHTSSAREFIPEHSLHWGVYGMRMRAVFSVLTLLLFLAPATRASIITNDNTTLVFFGDSYDTYPYHYFGDYLASWAALGHPQFTNHWSSASRSGGSIEEANEDRLERLGLAHWESGQRAIGLIMADDDGGYTSNQVQMNLTNTLVSPTSFFNGLAYTNEGGWCATQNITWIGIGAVPHESADGDSGEIARNNAVTNMFMLLGRPYVDMWNPLWTGGWSNDINSGASLLGFYSGGHPYASGSLTMGITIAQKLADKDTNVSLATVDFSTGRVVATNHCVITSISKSGSSISFTRHDDRLPMAFDVSDGTITNDCRDAFIAMPELSNAFWFTIAVTNLPAGNYSVNIDGAPVTTLSSSALAAGWNMFTDWNSNSPYWKQRVEVLALVRLKNGADPVTLYDHSASEAGPDGLDLVNYDSYSQLFWDEGYRGDALAVALQFISTNLDALDALIRNAAQPTNHVFTIMPIQVLNFPPDGDPSIAPNASVGQPYACALSASGAMPSDGTLTFAKTCGPAWLNVSAAGNLWGTPAVGDIGTNLFTVTLSGEEGDEDDQGDDESSNSADFQIVVNPAPLIASLSPQGTNLVLTWTGGQPPYLVQMSSGMTNPFWQTIASGITNASLLLEPSGTAGFYRVQCP